MNEFILQKEIDELIHGVLTNEDEDAVEDEYNELIKESLPDVPRDKMPVDVEPELPEIPADPGNILCNYIDFIFLYNFL